jgi:two-component system, NarL family, nitrate/nitrite response regulator NarL
MQLAAPIAALSPSDSPDHSNQSDNVRVLLMEHDPISRHVIGQTLKQSSHIHSITESENCGAVGEHKLRAIDVVLISCSHKIQCLNADQLRQVLQGGPRVMSLREEWTRPMVEKAIASGVSGFFVKGPQLAGLPAAILAVSKGQAVFAPGIMEAFSGLTPHSRQSQTARVTERMGVRQPLTPREYEVLRLLGQGMSTTEAAASLSVTTATVKSHVSHSLAKLGARNRLEAVLMIGQS